MTLKEDVKYIKATVTGIIVFCALTIIMLSLTYGYVKELSAQNNGKQEIEISTYNGTECMLWYRGQAEIIEVTNNQIVYIDENGLERNLFTGNGIVTITKYK